MILALLLATQPAPSLAERAWFICNYVASPACARLGDDDRFSRQAWRALHRPFPGWTLGTLYAAGTCADERISRRSNRACYGSYLRELEMQMQEQFVADRDQREFRRLFCNDTLYAEIADDSGPFSDESVMAERALICRPENQP